MPARPVNRITPRSNPKEGMRPLAQGNAPSNGQTCSRHRDPDDEAFGLPVPGDFSPPSPAIVVRTRRSPKPLFPVGGATSGPPRSVHVIMRVSPWFAQWIWIRPAVAESTPYLVEFVAN